MKKFVVPALAIAALAGSALGQNSSNAVQLQLRIVPQDGLPPGVVTDLASSPTVTGSGQTRRFEVQYRIFDQNTGDTVVPAGLVSGALRITLTGGAAGNSTLTRALLTRSEAQLAGANPPPNPDSSGANNNGAEGLHRPFRGGIPSPAPNNTNPANGVISADSKTISGITPLSLAQSDQGNINAGQDNATWYGLYSFNIVSGSSIGNGDATITAQFDADMTTMNRFGFFNDADPVPWTSQNAQAATATQSFIPAPGAMALLGLGGLIAGRRRRA